MYVLQCWSGGTISVCVYVLQCWSGGTISVCVCVAVLVWWYQEYVCVAVLIWWYHKCVCVCVAVLVWWYQEYVCMCCSAGLVVPRGLHQVEAEERPDESGGNTLGYQVAPFKPP